jgi:hypothetical protein
VMQSSGVGVMPVGSPDSLLSPVALSVVVIDAEAETAVVDVGDVAVVVVVVSAAVVSLLASVPPSSLGDGLAAHANATGESRATRRMQASMPR